MVMAKLRAYAMALSVLVGISAPVAAQDIPTGVPSAGAFDIVDEVRLGIHFHRVYYTMIPQNLQKWDMERLENVSFDVLFTSPDMDAFRWIGSPRPEIGATINMSGEDSLFHAGLTWTVPLFDSPFYVEGTFGAAATTGYLNDAPPGRANYGCRINFYERFGVGAHLLDNLTATLTYEHSSNAGLCDRNDGISNVGLRLGWKF